MSMLAEPRRKQKIINLRAKNNAWSNDNNKFGQRMLEKMGWSVGKGLGAHENGIVEHVVAKYKNDEKGLGYKDKNDQWTKHEDGFNALLASLSKSGDKNEKLHSGISLEDKSKKSKVRVHYHKFTRAKDLSRYSEKDLANIFGKKSFENEDKIEETLKEDIKTSEQIFTDKGSMDDYFKRKLSALKSKDQNDIANNYTNTKNTDDDNDVDHGFQGFSNVNSNTEVNEMTSPLSFYNNKSTNFLANSGFQCDQNKAQKQKIKDIKQVEGKNIAKEKKTDNQVKHCDSEKDEQELNISKKVKRKKYDCDIEESEFYNNHCNKKKKKKDKNKEKTPKIVLDNNADSIIKSKKNKKKHKDIKCV